MEYTEDTICNKIQQLISKMNDKKIEDIKIIDDFKEKRNMLMF